MKSFSYRTDHILFQIFEINSSTYFLRGYYLKLVTHEVIKFLGSNENKYVCQYSLLNVWSYIYIKICKRIYKYIYIYIYIYTCLSVYIYLSIYLSVYLFNICKVDI